MLPISLSLTVLGVVSGALAIPEYTAVPLADGCAAFPGYDAATKEAFPLLAKVVNSENPAIEGFTNTEAFSIATNARGPYLRWGYLTFPSDNAVAKNVLRCTNNTLQGRVSSSFNGASFGVTWEPLSFTDLPYQDFMFHPVRGAPIRPFAHVVNGTQLDGVFLGGYVNSTVWGIKPQAGSIYEQYKDYFLPRLLGPNSADPSTGKPLFENEFKGWIQIVKAN